MTVGRAISPECSTDERREWQKEAAALAISSRRPTGWLGSRMMRSMYASGSSPDAAASCRTSSFARLTAPLGRPAPGRFPPCPFIVLSRGRPKTAGRTISGSGSSVPQYGTVAKRGAVRFRYREGASPFTERARNTQVHHCCADSARHARRGFQRRRARRRQVPRYIVGSVNLTEFFITFATSATFIVTLESANLAPVIPLVFGGLVSGPFAGYLVKIVSSRLLMLIVGSLLSQAKNFRQIIVTRSVHTVDPNEM